VEYNYVKFIGKTIYTGKTYKNGWYCSISDTFLKRNEVYKLLDPLPVNKIYNKQGLFILDTIYIEDDIIRKYPNVFKDYPLYNGGYYFESNKFVFISNREYNLDYLV
jgi:hypothetical protein